MAERYRAIIIKDNQLVVMERHKHGKHFWVFPGGKREKNETEKECCEREVKEEFGIDVKAKNMIYKIFQNNEHQGFFVCDWISGNIHKTDAEEYSSKSPELYGTYNPVSISLNEIEKYDLKPIEVKNQLIKDLKNFGQILERPLIEIEIKIK